MRGVRGKGSEKETKKEKLRYWGRKWDRPFRWKIYRKPDTNRDGRSQTKVGE